MKRVVKIGILSVYVLLRSVTCFADGVADGTGNILDEAKASAEISRAQPEADSVPAIEQADSETVAVAIGHYARSRSLLIAALNEFDLGTKKAKPDAILNSKEWRSDLVARAEDLNHILAPQPKVTKGGIKYEADRRLLASEANGK